MEVCSWLNADKITIFHCNWQCIFKELFLLKVINERELQFSSGVISKLTRCCNNLHTLCRKGRSARWEWGDGYKHSRWLLNLINIIVVAMINNCWFRNKRITKIITHTNSKTSHWCYKNITLMLQKHHINVANQTVNLQISSERISPKVLSSCFAAAAAEKKTSSWSWSLPMHQSCNLQLLLQQLDIHTSSWVQASALHEHF